jgi:nucleolar protein 56
MKTIIVTSIIGVLGFGEKGKLIDKKVFPRNALKIAENLIKIESGILIDEITDLIEKLGKKGYDLFVFESTNLARIVKEKLGLNVEVSVSPKPIALLLKDLGGFAFKVGFIEDPSDLTELIHDVSMEMSRIKVREKTETRDILIIQTVQAVDDLEKMLNLLMGRLREWYGLHFPELDRLIDNHETYARLVYKFGKRFEFTSEHLEGTGFTKKRSSQVAKASKRSMGAIFNQKDIKQIQLFCEKLLNLFKAKSGIETYLKGLMEEVCPNLSALAGSTLGARLIALAGGLVTLAKKPASTIQVLGAEKALFRSITSGARPPKHGVIFQHSIIHGAKIWQRGNLARALAGKLAIAIRIDAFGGKFIGEKLKEDLQKRINEIEKKYEKPKKTFTQPKQKKSTRHVRRGRRRKRYGRRS